MRHQHLELRTEGEHAVRQHRIKQGLYAEPVPRQEKGVPISVVQREREHSAEAFDAGFAPRLPRMDDDFGIATGAESMAQGFEFRHQFLEVVDFAVEDDDHRAVFVEQGLLTAGQVDDRQPSVRQSETRFEMVAALVGSAMKLSLVHPVQQVPILLALASRIEQTCNATHAEISDSGACAQASLLAEQAPIE